MSKLRIISAARMARILRHLGYSLVRQEGNHAYFRHEDGRATVVPMHKGEDLGRGLIRAILRDVELTPEEYALLCRKVR
jgi:predicted RNA binding protein YcfA (HicA-like mRNA interferase family)